MKGKLRLIARLDVKDENLVKGIQFEGLRKLGPPRDFARRYYRQGIDEVLYLDTVASLYGRNNLAHVLEEATRDVFVPITAGGGLRSVEDVRALLRAGADKAAINTAALLRPSPCGCGSMACLPPAGAASGWCPVCSVGARLWGFCKSYSGCSTTISGAAPSRRGGPEVPMPRLTKSWALSSPWGK